MRSRRFIYFLLCLLCVAGAWFLWQREIGRDGSPSRPHQAVAPAVRPHLPSSVATGHSISTNAAQISMADWNTNKFAGRLSNTPKTIGQLANDSHVILLANALIDTLTPLNFVFPKNLQSSGDPGAYIVQARGPIDNAFRALLAQSGATIVSYIPNNAYLVRAPAGVAGALEASPKTQAVIPYEPYYKIQSPMLSRAVGQMDLPDGTVLTLGLFADDVPATMQQIKKLGGQVVAEDQSPFGPVLRVIPPRNWTTLAVLSGVQIVEPYHTRASANDLSRAAVGVAADTITTTNYLGLTGAGVTVEVNDTGIDTNHPDFNGSGTLRIIGDAPQSLVDTNGHGTHVAGIIAGDGTKSMTVTNVPGSILPGGTGTNFQFRGMAPLATLYSVGGIPGGWEANMISDRYFQEAPALTNALISNNSWTYGNSTYDLAAASYDAAVRDALPEVTGSQPVLFVFAAGNGGNGRDDSDFGGGIADSIESPATAKNVITVGAIQEHRNITNSVINGDGSPATPWQPETSTSYRVAGFSSRGNVGIGTEGTFGRYKPDVVAPGTFTVSTRSEQWDVATYFFQSPTNNQISTHSGIIVQPGSVWKNVFPSVPTNAVQLIIYVNPPALSPFLFNFLPIYVSLFTSTTPDFATFNDAVLIPGSPEAPANYLQQIQSTEGFLGGFNYAVSNNTASQISFNLFTDVITTNNPGNYFLVLSNLNQSIGTINGSGTGPGPYYRYETGTSMAAADVSGVLALMQQFYVAAYGVKPSPAMLKAMLINGARATGFYNFQAQNTLNYEGWGLVNLPASLPPGLTNQLSVTCSDFIQDQSPTNALATGDSQTFQVLTTNAQPLRVTLAWTDPPGDPAAAIKLVNDLNLVVTNFSNSTNPVVYYGNDIPAASTFNSARGTNAPPNFDSINNIENVYLPLGAGTNFSVTVMGYRVNVNAVTAHTNNVVQDYALVISCGNGQLTNVMTVTANPVVTNLTTDQQITYLAATNNNGPLLNQLVGANTPLLGTNTLPFTATAPEGFGTNWQVTVGMTNQWHFYVVTNTFAATNSSFTNAAFVTFLPPTLSIPREGVYQGTVANATRPEADIDLYVSTESGLTNLDPTVLSNAVALSTQVGATVVGLPFRGVSLGRGGTEFVADSNSQPSEVYYIGVKSEDQMASEYGFISIFSSTPFSQMQNGNQVVNGVPLPVNIPDGTPAHPGNGFVFGLALYPIQVGQVTVSNLIWHQNFGDLIGTLTLNGSQPDVLNNHDSFGNPPGPYSLSYNDSAGGGIPGSRPSDGPGSLNNFISQQGAGVWRLTEVDGSLTQTGNVAGLNLTIQPHQDLTQGIPVFVEPGSWFYDYVDVPPGATNLTVIATNLDNTAAPPLELFVKLGAQPTINNFDGMAVVDNPTGIGTEVQGTVSLGPPLTSGRYFVGIFNPSFAGQNVYLIAHINSPGVPGETIFSSSGPVPIHDDAVTTDTIGVSANETISSMEVALRVNHPRVSDLVFHLISPDGTRELLVENRGGTTTNGMGATYGLTNLTGLTFSHVQLTPTTAPSTNVIDTGATVGTLQINYNFWNVQPDQMLVYNGGLPIVGSPIFDSGIILGSGVFNIPYGPGASTEVTVVMNPVRNPGFGDRWDYTVSVDQAYYAYLVLTEDTKKTTTPIKFAPPPLRGTATIISNIVWTNSFEGGPAGNSYPQTGTYFQGWLLEAGGVKVLTNGFFAPEPTHYIDMDGTNRTEDSGLGRISTNLVTIPGQSYVLSFDYSLNPFGIDVVDRISGVQVFQNTSPLLTVWVTNKGGSSSTAAFVSTSVVFTATSAFTKLVFQSTNSPQLPGLGTNGLLLDAIKLATVNATNGDIFYLPEQSLDTFDGKSAQGLWTLEIQDDRAGASNNATLVSWQLRFNFTTTGTNASGIPPGSPQTNVIQPGSFAYYPVNVPANADAASNILVFATGPLNVWFNQTNNPTGTNPPDFLLLGGSTSGTAVLGFITVPPLLPGQTYFIGLQNTNSFAVTNGFQVDFHLIPPPPSLTNGVTVTNIVSSNSIVYYSVTVPTNADYATNLLLFADLPLNVWFNQNGLPVGANPPDYLLITNATNGISILSAGSTPPLIPGLTYFLGVQNTNGVAVTFGLQVDFHFLSPPSVISGLTITATNNGVTNGFLLKWSGPTNYQYAIQWTTNLAPPIAWNTVLNPLINLVPTPTNGHYSWFDDGSLSGGWPPAKFYRVVASLISGPITNSTPVTNVIVAGTMTPLTVTVPVNAIAASNLLISASGPLNVYFNQTTAPTGTNVGDLLMLSNVTSGSFVLTNGSVPTLVPGASYHLGLQNPGTSNITFVFQVNFAFAAPPSTNPASISSVTLTNLGGGTNAILLKWIAPTNYQFQVQWTTNLAPPVAWNTISNVVLTWSGILSLTNAADGLFQFLDDGSLTGGFGPQKFYRLIQYPYSTPIPQALSIINPGIIAGSVRFQWLAPTNYSYQIQWTTNLALPFSNWSILANPALGLSNGVFTFTDTNQTGPATSPKFFRLIEQ